MDTEDNRKTYRKAYFFNVLKQGQDRTANRSPVYVPSFSCVLSSSFKVHFDVDVEGSSVGERVVPACFITIVGQYAGKHSLYGVNYNWNGKQRKIKINNGLINVPPPPNVCT